MSDFHRTLVVVSGKSPGKRYPLEVGENLIGRWDSDEASFPEIDLDSEDVDAMVSRKHALITINSESEAFVEDIDSLNGTFLRREGDDKLEAHRPYPIAPGDVVVFGSVAMRFE